MIPAAAYLRRSTTKQEQSLDGQSEAVESYATKHGYKIVRRYVDDGISGATGEARPEFLRMVSDAQSGSDFRAILAYDLSRFGRMDTDETGHYRYMLKRAGVEIIFTNENDGGDGEAGEILRPVLGLQKREFLKQMSRDTLRGQIQAFNKGWISGRAAPFGYDRVLIDSEGKERQRLKRGEKVAKPRGWHVSLAISDTPGEAETVRWIFETYTTREIGLASLAAELNARGKVSSGGLPWVHSVVRELLQNPTYKGQLVFGRRAMGAFHQFRGGEIIRAKGGYGKVIEKPESEWLTFDRPDLALVAPEVWESVQQTFKRRGTSSGRQLNKADYPLSGVVYCGDCGAPMVGQRRESYLTYRCSSRHRNRTCHPNQIRANVALDVIREVVKREVFADGDMQALRASVLAAAKARPECRDGQPEQLKRDMAKAKADYERAGRNLLVADPDHLPMLTKALDDLRQRVKALESQISTTKSHSPEAVADSVCAKAQRTLDDLLRAPGDRLKAILRELVGRFEIRFEWAKWGKRQVRLATGASLDLNLVTPRHRGEWI